MSAAAWNIAGLVLVLVGVLLLFRYGMPYRVRTGGDQFIILEQKDQNDIEAEKLYGALGWIGLALVVCGTAFQVAANIPHFIR
jgi:hypothetical protein